jgi:hypothetical protein
MSARELRRALRAFGKPYRVRVKNGVHEHLIECHDYAHARTIAASYVHRGKAAHIEAIPDARVGARHRAFHAEK